MLNACEPCVYIHDGPPCVPATLCASTPAYVSLARVRVSARLRLGKTDVAVFVRLRMRVTATKYAYPPPPPPHPWYIVIGIMTKRMLQ